MRLKILHELEYRYSQPVYLEPHTFFLKPRENRHQKLLNFELAVRPEPWLSSDFIDPFGNDACAAWFKDLTDTLKIRSVSEVEVRRTNPFDYAVHPAFSRLPARYAPANQAVLSAYLNAPSSAGAAAAAPEAPGGGPVRSESKVIRDFSEKIAVRTKGSVLAFLPELCRTISDSFEKIHRPDGAPWSGTQVLAQSRGSCRDLTMLFIECCRTQGLAARFVSGYFEGDPESPENELHAWAEVYVEGGGWRGFDPTAGLAVSESHVLVAAAGPPEAVSPVIGTFRGTAQSTLTTRVQIERA